MKWIKNTSYLNENILIYFWLHTLVSCILNLTDHFICFLNIIPDIFQMWNNIMSMTSASQVITDPLNMQVTTE